MVLQLMPQWALEKVQSTQPPTLILFQDNRRRMKELMGRTVVVVIWLPGWSPLSVPFRAQHKISIRHMQIHYGCIWLSHPSQTFKFLSMRTLSKRLDSRSPTSKHGFRPSAIGNRRLPRQYVSLSLSSDFCTESARVHLRRCPIQNVTPSVKNYNVKVAKMVMGRYEIGSGLLNLWWSN
jgi:hypothetical protein